MKKLIAPIVITIILVCIFTGYLVLLLLDSDFLPVRIIGAIVILALTGVSVFVLVERIKEVRSGVEDDLGQY